MKSSALAFYLAVVPLFLHAQQNVSPSSKYYPAHPVLQTQPHDRVSSSLIMEEMPLVAPLFIEDAEMTSDLVLVNNSAIVAGATVSTRNLQGVEIGHLHIKLAPNEQRHFAVSSLQSASFTKYSFGSISVLQDADLKGQAIAAQLLIADHRNSTPGYLDEELAMPDMQGSSILRSVTDEAQGEPLLAVTNLASTVQKVSVQCLAADQKRVLQTLSIQPLATSLTSGCSSSSLSNIKDYLSEKVAAKDRGVHAMEIVGDGGAGELAAFAIAAHPRGSDHVFSSVPFSDPGLIHSPDVVFAGVPIGP